MPAVISPAESTSPMLCTKAMVEAMATVLAIIPTKVADLLADLLLFLPILM